MESTKKKTLYNFTWNDIQIPDDIIENWQRIVDIMAEIFNVPAGLIMKVHPPTIEVFISSKSEGNPYEIGEEADLPGLYCNTVMQSHDRLLVPNALKDPIWDHNPDIKQNMISYLGMPINWPDGDTFGTICVLDSKENNYSPKLIKLLNEFKKMAENHLHIIIKNIELTKANDQIKTFSRIIPKCVYCEKIKIEEDTWISVDEYLKSRRSTEVTHSICPTCLKNNYDKIMEN